MQLAKGSPFEINSGILKVKYSPEEGILKPTVTVKYDTVFYKSDKFRMDGPQVDSYAKTIYNNLTHESGETERFFYFDKFFYEHLLRNAESSSEQLRADVIIGNDWQTGGISAMMKLLTTAKRFFGLDPKVAEKLYNTPVITIMHNAGLAGNVWHSQPKLFKYFIWRTFSNDYKKCLDAKRHKLKYRFSKRLIPRNKSQPANNGSSIF